MGQRLTRPAPLCALPGTGAGYTAAMRRILMRELSEIAEREMACLASREHGRL